MSKRLIFIISLCILGVLLLSACKNASATNVPDDDMLDPLPPWDYAKAAQAITTGEISCGGYPIGGTPEKTRLLLWRTIEDTRPLRVDEAIWWAEFSLNHPYWVLAHAYRHPDPNTPDSGEWKIAGICDSSYDPIPRFDQPPSNHDVLILLEELSPHITDDVFIYIDKFWSSGATTEDGYFKVLASGFRKNTWKATIENK